MRRQKSQMIIQMLIRQTWSWRVRDWRAKPNRLSLWLRSNVRCRMAQSKWSLPTHSNALRTLLTITPSQSHSQERCDNSDIVSVPLPFNSNGRAKRLKKIAKLSFDLGWFDRKYIPSSWIELNDTIMVMLMIMENVRTTSMTVQIGLKFIARVWHRWMSLKISFWLKWILNNEHHCYN